MSHDVNIINFLIRIKIIIQFYAYIIIYILVKFKKTNIKETLEAFSLTRIMGKPLWWIRVCVFLTNTVLNIIKRDLWKRKSKLYVPYIFIKLLADETIYQLTLLVFSIKKVLEPLILKR